MSLNELRNGIPGTRYSTLVPGATSGVVPRWKSSPVAPSTDDTKAAANTATRISTCLRSRVHLSRNPAIVATATIAMAVTSPPKRRQNDALASATRASSAVPFCLSDRTMAL